jgi:hypothetical protein
MQRVSLPFYLSLAGGAARSPAIREHERLRFG